MTVDAEFWVVNFTASISRFGIFHPGNILHTTSDWLLLGAKVIFYSWTWNDFVAAANFLFPTSFSKHIKITFVVFHFVIYLA